ncbi:competence type IV pilus major pilin ComGC [Bacillus solimangrovi]|uniref:Competence protein ComG n=1 Tax=Bacillus solimangrovi TaxID=1305675 RepID=A0A1E5LFM0_9BACI|nr:competence type IV pilus major pilin ComGC [Bacillus solimangrovi]OEH92885.1 competence protein ComG [Bacillus solimangrovi]
MNERGFTLIEMLIVLMIISTLLLITVPNITKHNAVVKDKGCSALVKLVEAQVQAYEIEHSEFPDSIADLRAQGYIETEICPGGEVLTLDTSDGSVSASATP